MIILSGVLVVLAIALLVTGIVTGNTGHPIAGLDGLKLIYVSIGVSIISALCLAIGVFVRRKELFGTVAAPAERRAPASRAGKAATSPAKAKARVGAGGDTVPVAPTTATDVPAETTVYVVPGRKRYHLETCRQLAGRGKEELTFEEAREEGFTACTACLPDTALAARAAISGTGPIEEDRPSQSTAARAGSLADIPEVTRTDLPVTKGDTAELEPATADLIKPVRPTPADSAPVDAESTMIDSAVPAEDSDVTEAPEAEEPADTAEFTEPAAERPAVRSRSLFEPLYRDTSESGAEDDTTATTDETDGDEDVTVEPSGEERSESEKDESERSDTEHTGPEETEPEEPADSVPAEAQDTEAAEPAERPEPEDDAADGSPEDTTTVAEDDEPAAEPEPAPADDHDDQQDSTAEPEAEDDRADDEDEDSKSGSPSLPFVRILSGTKRYHRPDCALIEDIADDADDLEILSPGEAKERGCTPCLVCQPDKDGSDDLY